MDFYALGGADVPVDPRLEPQIDDADKKGHDYDPASPPPFAVTCATSSRPSQHEASPSPTLTGPHLDGQLHTWQTWR